MSDLAQQEIVDNVDETIDNRFRIPRRTTFGKGGTTFTDGGSLSVAVPFHILAANAGTATGQAGTASDTFQLSLVPEVDGPALSALRVFYQAAVFPDDYPDISSQLAARLHTRLPLIYWTNLDGTPSSHEPPRGPTDWLVGRGSRHEIWTSDPEAFYSFMLLTLGTSLSSDRATNSANSGAPSVVADRQRPARLGAAKGAKSGAAASHGTGKRIGVALPDIPSPNKPVMSIEPSNSKIGRQLDQILQQIDRPKLPQGDLPSVVPTQPR